METDELSMLYTHMLSSIDFTIPTIAILDLAAAVDTWIIDGDCGAIVYGRPRCKRATISKPFWLLSRK